MPCHDTPAMGAAVEPPAMGALRLRRSHGGLDRVAWRRAATVDLARRQRRARCLHPGFPGGGSWRRTRAAPGAISRNLRPARPAGALAPPSIAPPGAARPDGRPPRNQAPRPWNTAPRRRGDRPGLGHSRGGHLVMRALEVVKQAGYGAVFVIGIPLLPLAW